MAARRPNLTNALIELGFCAVAAIFGVVGAPQAPSVAGLTLAMVVYWGWSRRRTLHEMRRVDPGRLAITALGTLILLSLALWGFHFLGRLAAGWSA